MFNFGLFGFGLGLAATRIKSAPGFAEIGPDFRGKDDPNGHRPITLGILSAHSADSLCSEDSLVATFMRHLSGKK